MLTLIFSTLLLLAAAEWENQVPSSEGATKEPECVFRILSPITVSDDPSSKSYVNTNELEIVWPNENITCVTGQFELMKKIDILTRLEIVLRKNHMTMVTLEMDICKEMNLGEKSDYYNLLKFFVFPPECPISPGTYSIKDLVVDLDDLPINSGNIGDYEAIMKMKYCTDKNCNQSTFLAALRLTCVIEPV